MKFELTNPSTSPGARPDIRGRKWLLLPPSPAGSGRPRVLAFCLVHGPGVRPGCSWSAVGRLDVLLVSPPGCFYHCGTCDHVTNDQLKDGTFGGGVSYVGFSSFFLIFGLLGGDSFPSLPLVSLQMSSVQWFLLPGCSGC